MITQRSRPGRDGDRPGMGRAPHSRPSWTTAPPISAQARPGPPQPWSLPARCNSDAPTCRSAPARPARGYDPAPAPAGRGDRGARLPQRRRRPCQGDQANGPGQVLEFTRDVLGPRTDEHVGFGQTLDAADRGRSSARADNTGCRADVPGHGRSGRRTLRSPASIASAQHVYRIEWSASDVTYFVDGRRRSRRTPSPIASPMRPVVSDFVAETRVVTVDSLRQMAFPRPGTFSRESTTPATRAPCGAG